jgi:hypothetical protein
MKTLLYLLGVAALVLLLGCEKSRERQNFEQDFERALESAISTNPPSIQVSSLTHFSYDKLFNFHPYTQPKDIDTQLGFKWNSGLKDEIEYQDGFNLLVFVKDGKVIQYARVRRNLCTWDLDNRNGFAPGKDVFELKKSTNSSEITLSIRPITGQP